MYTRMRQPRLGVYNADTGEYIGEAFFQLTPQMEKEILDFLNYKGKLSSLLILNTDFYPISPDYVPPEPYVIYKRKGKLMGLFTDSSMDTEVPIEIDMRYNQLIRSEPTNGPYNFYSVELDDIVVEDVKKGEYTR